MDGNMISNVVGAGREDNVATLLSVVIGVMFVIVDVDMFVILHKNRPFY